MTAQITYTFWGVICQAFWCRIGRRRKCEAKCAIFHVDSPRIVTESILYAAADAATGGKTTSKARSGFFDAGYLSAVGTAISEMRTAGRCLTGFACQLESALAMSHVLACTLLHHIVYRDAEYL